MLLNKLKDYARSKKLDKEAHQDKQAVDLKPTEGEVVEEWPAGDEWYSERVS